MTLIYCAQFTVKIQRNFYASENKVIIRVKEASDKIHAPM